MTDEERDRCRSIINAASFEAARNNAISIPGLDVSTDLWIMADMFVSLAAVFGKKLTPAQARRMAKTALKRLMGKYVKKELLKIIPFIGSTVSMEISFELTKTAGWQLVQHLDLSRKQHCALP